MKACPTEADYRAAREYLERAVPKAHRALSSAVEWEEAVRKCAHHTARLRRASEEIAKRPEIG